jgi:hypothetical protein
MKSTCIPWEGIRNKDEGWIAVDFEVKTPGRTTELNVFAANVGKSTSQVDGPFSGRCARNEVVLHCRIDKAADGSPVALQASTEDITGGVFGKGFSADVIHVQDHATVLVSEILPKRNKPFVGQKHFHRLFGPASH